MSGLSLKGLLQPKRFCDSLTAPLLPLSIAALGGQFQTASPQANRLWPGQFAAFALYQCSTRAAL